MTRYDEVKRRSLRLLDYLAALALEVSTKPKRRIDEYDPPMLAPADVPKHRDVLLGPTASREPWLQVGKVEQPAAPDLPAALLPYLGDVPIDMDAAPTLPADAGPTPPDATGPRPSQTGDDPADHQRILDEWVRTVWTPWSEEARAARAARQLYQRLYDLRLRLQRDTTTHELVWGFGILSWALPEATVQHPLLLTSAVIEIDVDTGVLSVVPDGPAAVETDALQGLGLQMLDKLVALRERLRTSPPDPWTTDGLGDVYAQVVGPLGLDARVAPGPDLPAPTPDPVLVDSWVAFVRPRPGRHRRFYEELRQVLDERDVLPEAIAAIVSDESVVDQAVAETTGRSAPGGPASWDVLGERLLMPLPTNDEQERIAVQLGRSRGVTVQGPPGTGKSHTIANLVSHLVAHGKRVLVTAHNEQALTVLRGKIPEELRDLSLAVLGSNQAALGELRASVEAIMDAVAKIDIETETAAVGQLAADLDAARGRARTLELRLVDLLRDEAAEFPMPGDAMKAAEVAAWLAIYEPDLDRIPDRIDLATTPPLDVAELAELYAGAADLSADDAFAARTLLPGADSLPTGTELRGTFDTLDQLRHELADLQEQGVTVEAVDEFGIGAVEALIRDTASAADDVARLEDDWLVAVRSQVAQATSFAAFWSEQAAALSASVDQIVELRGQTFGHEITLPDGDPRLHLAHLDELARRFAAGKGVPRLGGRALRAVHESARVDGLELRTAAEVGLVTAELQERTARATAAGRYAELVTQLGAPPLEVEAPSFLAEFEAATARLHEAISWETADGPALMERLRDLLPEFPSDPDSDQLRLAAELLTAAARRTTERDLTARLDDLRRELETGQGEPHTSPLWGVLREALERRDLSGWSAALAEAERLVGLRPRLNRRDELADRLRAAAPLWTAAILDQSGEMAACGDPDQLADLWRWRQAETWLEDLHGHGDVVRLQRQYADAAGEVHRLVLAVASRAARLGVKRHLRDDQRRALIGWLQALKRIGKGTGKFAGKWEAEAREEMPAAMGAVPIWIMPIHRVLQSFDPRRTELFDVVIVDESSQCDVLSLGVLGLGRKVVVVGDDKQISPAAVGVDRARVFALIETHLPDLPQRALLDVEASLYDTSTRAFPGVVLLREHFRCTPSIIGFSNRFYDGKILPLREAPDLGIGAAIRPVRISDGVRTSSPRGDVNEPEARAVVDQILACCDDEAYEQMTFGVVTLLGSGQARLIEQLLVDKLGVEEYERRHLRVGDPYQFQGDERDVVFISIVADDNRFAATRRADQQRINVAASRARDQMWIYHSVEAADLHPDDVRGLLLDYAYGHNPPERPVDGLEARCESTFERDVLDELVKRGFRVSPQHPVGHLRIDLVVEGAGDRLAIECDGDQFHGPEQWEADLRRQRVLERQGWRFCRLRGSAYYRHPVDALAPLWDRLAQLGIRPVGTDA